MALDQVTRGSRGPGEEEQQGPSLRWRARPLPLWACYMRSVWLHAHDVRHCARCQVRPTLTFSAVARLQHSWGALRRSVLRGAWHGVAPCCRLDVSVHPFTGGAHPTDVRMTTRYKAEDLTEGLSGTIHETGHALYEQVHPTRTAEENATDASCCGTGSTRLSEAAWHLATCSPALPVSPLPPPGQRQSRNRGFISVTYVGTYPTQL